MQYNDNADEAAKSRVHLGELSETRMESEDKPIQLEYAKWVCLKIGYIPIYSHLIGIMISKTIGFRGTQHFQTHPNFVMRS